MANPSAAYPLTEQGDYQQNYYDSASGTYQPVPPPPPINFDDIPETNYGSIISSQKDMKDGDVANLKILHAADGPPSPVKLSGPNLRKGATVGQVPLRISLTQAKLPTTYPNASTPQRQAQNEKLENLVKTYADIDGSENVNAGSLSGGRNTPSDLASTVSRLQRSLQTSPYERIDRERFSKTAAMPQPVPMGHLFMFAAGVGTFIAGYFLYKYLTREPELTVAVLNPSNVPTPSAQ